MSAIADTTISPPPRHKAPSHSKGRSVSTHLLVAMALCLTGGLALNIDLNVSRWMHTRQGLAGLHQPLQVVESIGDSTGVAILLFTIFLVAIERRRELPRVIAAVAAAGLSADVIKFCVARLRPRSYPGDGLMYVNSFSDTFYGWFPLFRTEGPAFGSRYQSFPSAHTATAFALAIGLTKMYPRGGWWFLLLATGVALQRIETGAHYTSDVIFGAAVGLLAASSCHQGTSLSQWFDKLEQGSRTVDHDFADQRVFESAK